MNTDDLLTEREKSLVWDRLEELRLRMRPFETRGLPPAPIWGRLLTLPLAAAAVLLFVLNWGLSRAAEVQVGHVWESIVSDLWKPSTGSQPASFHPDDVFMDDWTLLPDLNESSLKDAPRTTSRKL